MNRLPALALAILLGGCAPRPVPDAPEAPLATEVEVAYLEGRWDQVIAELEPYRSLPPERGHAQKLEWLGRAYLARGDAADAADVLERALAGGPDADAERSIRAALAQAYLDAGRPAEALDELERLGPGAMAETDRLYLAGTAAARDGRWDAARDAFERLEAIDPEGLRGLQARARLPLVRLRRFAVQLGLFRSAHEADRLAERLRARGTAIDPLTAGQGERAIHLVVHGRFATFDEARAAAEELRRGASSDAIPVP